MKSLIPWIECGSTNDIERVHEAIEAWRPITATFIVTTNVAGHAAVFAKLSKPRGVTIIPGLHPWELFPGVLNVNAFDYRTSGPAHPAVWSAIAGCANSACRLGGSISPAAFVVDLETTLEYWTHNAGKYGQERASIDSYSMRSALEHAGFADGLNVYLYCPWVGLCSSDAESAALVRAISDGLGKSARWIVGYTDGPNSLTDWARDRRSEHVAITGKGNVYDRVFCRMAGDWGPYRPHIKAWTPDQLVEPMKSDDESYSPRLVVYTGLDESVAVAEEVAAELKG